MRFVATKTAEQLDLQALHRVRSRLVGERTAIAKKIRAFLLDRGTAVAKAWTGCGQHCRASSLRAPTLSPRLLHIIEDLVADWRRLDQRIDDVSLQIEALAKADAGCERLMTVPGVGPIISSATVAAIGTGDVFAKGRDFGAWLGLVPKQIPAGDRTILGKISKRGKSTSERCSCRPPASCCCGRSAGSTMASNPGSRRPRGGCTTTCWRSRSPTSSRDRLERAAPRPRLRGQEKCPSPRPSPREEAPTSGQDYPSRASLTKQQAHPKAASRGTEVEHVRSPSDLLRMVLRVHPVDQCQNRLSYDSFNHLVGDRQQIASENLALEVSSGVPR
jgi:hypothetical protein